MLKKKYVVLLDVEIQILQFQDVYFLDPDLS